MTAVTTHVLDTSAGRPAQGVAVELERLVDGGWQPVRRGATDADGRVGDLGPAGAGRWRLRFATAGSFYPEVTVEFVVTGQERHLHLPLLLNPFGYSTYRGS